MMDLTPAWHLLLKAAETAVAWCHYDVIKIWVNTNHAVQLQIDKGVGSFAPDWSYNLDGGMVRG
jgi:hypothetical protein